MSTAFAQSASEGACDKGNAEACFYTGAEYAQGKGVPSDKKKAIEFFLKACDGGVPDGCNTSGVLTERGDGNVKKDYALAVQYFERGCLMGHDDACSWAVDMRKNEHEVRDLVRTGMLYEKGCLAGSPFACKDGVPYFFNGFNGKYPGVQNLKLAGQLAEKSCNPKGRFSCYVAEVVYGNPQSEFFSADKALKYTKIGCESGVAQSCSNLGGIYESIGEKELTAETLERACQLGMQNVCPIAQSWRRYVTELAAYEKELRERNSTLNQFFAKGQYGAAVNMAIRQWSSLPQAEKAARAAMSAGRMGDINTQDLLVLASWFRDGPVRSSADRELASRGTGLEGSFGEGTNTAGAAAARYKALYGDTAPTPSVRREPQQATSVPSSSSIAAQVRDKYRQAHCGGAKIPSSTVCR